jgi:hypothetical protein
VLAPLASNGVAAAGPTAATDHRSQRWVDYPLAARHAALWTGGGGGGHALVRAVAGWVDDVPADLLAWLYGPCGRPAAAWASSKGAL